MKQIYIKLKLNNSGYQFSGRPNASSRLSRPQFDHNILIF